MAAQIPITAAHLPMPFHGPLPPPPEPRSPERGGFAASEEVGLASARSLGGLDKGVTLRVSDQAL
jgi:hypothetical protein